MHVKAMGRMSQLLFTYIAPYLEAVAPQLRVDIALFTFGLAALVGIITTGGLIDRWLRRLVLISWC